MVRIKHRYLLLNILYPTDDTSLTILKSDDKAPWTLQLRRPSSDRLDSRLLSRMIRDGVADLFGDYGAGMVAGSLQVKYLSNATSTAIIRVSRAHYRMVWAALSFITRIPKPVDHACVMRVVRVSGTIKKSEEEAIRRARAAIATVRSAEHASRLLQHPLQASGNDSEINEIDDVWDSNDLSALENDERGD